MTRRHLGAIARILRDARAEAGGPEALDHVIELLVIYFQSENVRFDSGKFIETSGHRT